MHSEHLNGRLATAGWSRQLVVGLAPLVNDAPAHTMGWVNSNQPERDEPSIERWRGLLYCAAVALRVLALLGLIGLLCAPIALGFSRRVHGGLGVGVAGVSGLLLLGVALTLGSVVLARMDWRAAMVLLDKPTEAPPVFHFREFRTVVRPLAYGVAMVTLGGAVALLVTFAVVGSCVALLSPVLTFLGDQANIGPFTISTWPQSAAAVLIALAVLVALVQIAPVVARRHALFAGQVLTSPEQRMRRDLAIAARSRKRLVRAYDVERRRIERDLHDGVQPQLMSVSMRLGLALSALPREVPGRDDVLRAQDQVKDSLQALRDFVRNIHPQVLVDHGLGAAVAELADNLPLPIAVHDRLNERLPSEVETSLYFCVAELLTNSVKHSAASAASVDITRSSRNVVTVRVEDNGCGGAGMMHQDSGGLAGIADRMEVLGGHLAVDSPLGGPTRATVSIQMSDVESTK